MDKSRSTQITDTVNKTDKSRYIPGTNFSNIINIIKYPTEIDIVKDNKCPSDLSVQRGDLAGITPDILRITRKNKRKKLQKLRSLEKNLFKNQ